MPMTRSQLPRRSRYTKRIGSRQATNPRRSGAAWLQPRRIAIVVGEVGAALGAMIRIEKVAVAREERTFVRIGARGHQKAPVPSRARDGAEAGGLIMVSKTVLGAGFEAAEIPAGDEIDHAGDGI